MVVGVVWVIFICAANCGKMELIAALVGGVLVVGLVVTLVGLKVWLGKEREWRGGCAGRSPYLEELDSCPVCGASRGEQCKAR